MAGQNFIRLRDALRSLETDLATVNDPIKRMLLWDGQFVSANVSILDDTVDAIHIQSSHDELVLILEGDCGFRVGDETKRVTAGGLIFIPRNTIHGPIIDSAESLFYQSSRRSSIVRRRTFGGQEMALSDAQPLTSPDVKELGTIPKISQLRPCLPRAVSLSLEQELRPLVLGFNRIT
ncbi:MAG: cupin domain-containing protein [Thermodesulfobacteriota bacterium]